MGSRVALWSTVVVVLAVALSGGCSSTDYSCSNGECEVSLSGDGATTEVDDNVEVVLVEADDDSADLSVAGRSVTCAEGQSVDVSGIGVTCDAVGDGEIELTLELVPR